VCVCVCMYITVVTRQKKCSSFFFLSFLHSRKLQAAFSVITAGLFVCFSMATRKGAKT
jgi:hypothetical protein